MITEITNATELLTPYDRTVYAQPTNLTVISPDNPPPPPPPNNAPVVNAGIDQTIALPVDTVSLNGMVTDDGPPGSLTRQWSQVNGPVGGSVVFQDPMAAATQAKATVAGVYVLRLNASDGQYASSDDMVLTLLAEPVPPPPPPSGRLFIVNNSAEFFQKAQKESLPGDMIQLKGAGPYTLGNEGLRGDPGNKFGHVFGGDKDNPVIVCPFPGDNPTLVGSWPLYSVIGAVFQDLNFGNGGKLGIRQADWINPKPYVSSFITIQRCRFTGVQPRFGFMEVAGNDLTIENNEINCSSASSSTLDHGIYLHGGQRNKIRNNFIRGVGAYGIHVYDEDGRVIDSPLIEGNTITGCRLRSGIIESNAGTSRVLGGIFRKNVLYNNPAGGIDLSSYGADMPGILIEYNTTYLNGSALKLKPVSLIGALVRKNIFYENRCVNSDGVGSTEGILLDDNVYWPEPVVFAGVRHTNDKIVNPLFVNPGVGDFHLQPGSPAEGYGAYAV